MYEPEHFPGLIIRVDEPKGVILLFASGKLVCTAAKEEDISDAIHKLKMQLTRTLVGVRDVQRSIYVDGEIKK